MFNCSRLAHRGLWPSEWAGAREYKTFAQYSGETFGRQTNGWMISMTLKVKGGTNAAAASGAWGGWQCVQREGGWRDTRVRFCLRRTRVYAQFYAVQRMRYPTTPPVYHHPLRTHTASSRRVALSNHNPRKGNINQTTPGHPRVFKKLRYDFLPYHGECWKNFHHKMKQCYEIIYMTC